MTIIALAALAVAVLAILLPPLSRRRARHLEQSQVQLEVAYRAAMKLVKDETVSDHVARFAAWFAMQGGSPRVSRSLMWDILNGTFARTAPTTPSPELRALTDEQTAALDTALLATLKSSAYADPVFGWASRRVIDWGFFEDKPQTRRMDALRADFDPCLEPLVAA